MRTTPPRAAEALLRRFLSPDDAEAIAGDLEEALRARAVRAGARRARFWYWRQVASVLWSHLLEPALEPDEPGTKGRNMSAVRQDLAYALRSLRKQPSFAVMSVVMLALGLGANVAIFSLVNALILKPLPFAQPDRLMMLHLLAPDRDAPGVYRNAIWSYPKYRVFREGQRVFESTAVFSGREWNLTGAGSAERVPVELVEHTYFDVLRVAPQIGRTFTAEDAPAPGTGQLVVLGHGFWKRRFGGDPAVIGRPVGFNGVSYTVLGVLPEGFRGLSGQAQIWAPVTNIDRNDLEQPMSHSLRAIGRLREGVTPDEAQAAMRVLGDRVDSTYKETSIGTPWSATAFPLDDERIDPLLRRSILLLLAAVVCVLLIVCVNLANLTLVRALARQREVAIRLALGASRWRIVRQLMTESLLLAILGTGAGVAVAYAAISSGAALMPDLALVLPRGQSSGLTRLGLGGLGFDAATLLFTCAAAATATVLFGLGPAWSASRRDLTATIKSGSSGAVASGGRTVSMRNLLLVGEMALALVLLTAGGLMLKSVARLQATELGFNPESLLTFRLTLPAPQYDPERATRVIEQLLERLEGQPGIDAVAYGSCPPVSGGCNGTLATFPGRPPAPRGREPLIGVLWASPRYFETMDIALVRGRTFTDRDRTGQPKVVVVNESAARAFWPGEDPVGQRIGVGQGGFRDGAEVVGVVADVQYRAVDAPAVAPDVYLPLLQSPRSLGIIYLRSGARAQTLAPIVRREVEALDADLPVLDVRMMADRFGDAIWRTRMSAWLLGVFSTLALLLAAIGIYSVMSQGVEQRRREIGVRMALGAARADILRLIIGRVVVIAVIGVAVGIAVGLPAMQVLSALLYQVTPGDPVVFATLGFALFAVAVFAGYLPARRATRVDPLKMLRAE
jgi:putative ABC transport system permease protein